MRVVPLENEDVNECWLADRDRFSYEAFNGAERLTTPMIRQGGAVEGGRLDRRRSTTSSRGLTQIIVEHGPQSVGALASPISTVEELYLLAKLVRGLGSENIDTRLREAAPAAAGGPIRWLGQPIAVALRAAAGAGRRLVPAQGPSAVRPAPAPGGARRAPR